MQHIFFIHFFAVVFAPLQRETSINLCVPVHFFFSPPLIFTLVAASISPSSHRRYKIFMFFFQRNWSPLFFISRSNSSSVIHVNVGIEIKLKERIGFHCYCVSISKRPGSYPKRAGTWNAKFHPGLNEGVDVSTDDFLRTKGCIPSDQSKSGLWNLKWLFITLRTKPIEDCFLNYQPPNVPFNATAFRSQ